MRTVQRRFTLIGAAVALLAAGCGTGPSEVGAAAIVGDTVLPLEQIQQRVDVVLEKEPSVQEMHKQRKLDVVARDVVTVGVQHELVVLAARREGVTVSEEAVTEAVELAGGAARASRQTVNDETSYRDWARDQLLLVEMARKYVDRMEVTFDFFYAKDKAEAVEKAEQVVADPSRMAEFVADAPRDERGEPLGGRDVRIHSAESPQFARTPVFSAEPGTVVAFAPDPGSAAWMVAHVTDRKTDARPSGESATQRLTPQMLQQIGLRLVERLAGNPEIRLSPRYGVWDATGVALAPSEGELTGYQAPVRQKAP